MLVRYLLWGAAAIALSLGVSGCTSVDYVYNDTLVKKGFISQESLKEDKEKSKDRLFYIPKQLGGIKVKDSSAPGGERLFLIRRDKSSVVAETQVFEGKSEYFDRAYFSFAANPKEYVGFEFRFEDDSNKYFEKAYFNIGANKKKSFVGVELRFVY